MLVFVFCVLAERLAHIALSKFIQFDGVFPAVLSTENETFVFLFGYFGWFCGGYCRSSCAGVRLWVNRLVYRRCFSVRSNHRNLQHLFTTASTSSFSKALIMCLISQYVKFSDLRVLRSSTESSMKNAQCDGDGDSVSSLSMPLETPAWSWVWRFRGMSVV